MTTNMQVKFLAIVRLGAKGQVTVPKEFRDEMQLETGTPIVVLRMGRGLLLIPEQTGFGQLCDRIAGVFAPQGVSEAEVLTSLPEARQLVFERHFPELAENEKSRVEAKRK